MASILKADTVQTQTGSGTFNLGAAGDTIKIASGVPGADKVLTSDASGNATWGDAGGGSLTYIDKSVALLDAGVIDFQEKKSSDYLFYLITGFAKPATSNVQFNVQLMDGDSAITTSNYLYRWAGSASDGNTMASSTTNDSWTTSINISADAPIFFSLQFQLQSADDEGWDGALIMGNTSYIKYGTSAGAQRTMGGTYPIDNADIDGFRLKFSSGDVDYHKVVLYGMKGS